MQTIYNHALASKKSIENLIDIFSQRTSIEEKYSKSIHKLSQDLENQDESLSPLFELLAKEFQGRAKQSNQFVNSMRNDLIAELKLLIETQNSKKLFEEAKKYEKDLSKAISEIQKQSLEYKQVKRELERQTTIMVAYNILSEYQDDTKIKQYYKVNELDKKTKEIEERYHFLIKEQNYLIEAAQPKLDEICKAFSKYQEQRVNSVKDAMLKQIIFEVSLSKNIQYDLDKITDKVNEYDVAKVSTSLPSYQFEKQEFQSYSSFIGASLQSFYSKEYDKMIQKQQEQDEEVAEIVRLAWEEQPIEGLEEIEAKCRSSRAFRYQVSCQLLTKGLKVSETVYGNLSKVIAVLVDSCCGKYEASPIRNVLKLSLVIQQKDAQKYLYNSMLERELWQNRDFWETVIIEEMYEKLGQLKKSQEHVEKEKIMILNILTNISQNMLMYKFAQEHIVDIMTKFSNFFGLNEDVSKELIAAVKTQ